MTILVVKLVARKVFFSEKDFKSEVLHYCLHYASIVVIIGKKMYGTITQPSYKCSFSCENYVVSYLDLTPFSLTGRRGESREYF